MTKNGTDSIRTLAQRTIDHGATDKEGSVRFSVTIEVTKSSPDVLKALGSFTTNERSIIIGQVFEALQDRIEDLIAIRCLLKKDALIREEVRKRVGALRRKKEWAVRRNVRRIEGRRKKKASLPDPSE